MKKRVLVLYASYGSGHKAVANYIKNYFKSHDSQLEILTLDLLDFSFPIFGKFTQKAAENLFSKHPLIWNGIYHLFDNKYSVIFANHFLKVVFTNKKLQQTVKSFNPNLTISTHFSGSNLIAYYNKKKITNSKSIFVATDYDVHQIWVKSFKDDDAIIVSNKNDIKNFKNTKIKRHKIKAFGIPIAPVIPKTFKRQQLLQKYGFKNNLPTCLFFAGSGRFTNKKILKYTRSVIKANLNINLIFVSGHDPSTKNLIESYVKKYKAQNCHVLGFADNVPELFSICDFCITKPGGITTTTALYFQKPTILVAGSGGQESANAKYFKQQGYGKHFKTLFTFNKFMRIISKNPSVLTTLNQRLKKTKNHQAMPKLYKLSKDILN